MIVTINRRAEWEAILQNIQPTPIYVTSDREWFRNGLGMLFQYIGGR